jgi:hypothetical protein
VRDLAHELPEVEWAPRCDEETRGAGVGVGLDGDIEPASESVGRVSEVVVVVVFVVAV